MRPLRFLPFLVLAACAPACASLIGIEDVHEGPDPDADDGGTAGVGGSASGGKALGGSSGAAGSSAGSGNAGGGSGGTAGNGGRAGASSAGKGGGAGSDGGAGAGGTSGSAGAGSGGSAAGGGSGGSGGNPGDPTVHGKVVNLWLHPLPDIHVMIGEASADTDENGEFTIADVPDTYDVKFVVTYLHANRDASYGWVYEGLTRRDPTLQVYAGLPERSGDIFIQPNATFDDTRQLLVGIGSEYGETAHSPSSAAGQHTSSIWTGPDTINARAHGLLWTQDDDLLPTGYLAYDELPVALTEMDEASIPLDLPDDTIQSGTISGSVTSATAEDRVNKVFVRFTSNANLELVWHYGTSLDASSFSYVVPSLPNGSITVMASEGTESNGALGVAHQDGLSMGQTDIALAIPSAAVLMAPPNEDTVDAASVFSWTGDAKTFVFHAEDLDVPNSFAGLYVVTANKQITLPTFPNGFGLAASHAHNWRVETHGAAESVDELAGAEGFADSFAESVGSSPSGPRKSSGTFTISGGRVFTAPP